MREIDRWLVGYSAGWFWSAKSPGRRVPGALHIEQGESPRVTLWDSIDEVPPSSSYHMPITQRHDVVLGRTVLGDMTLVDCHSSHFGVERFEDRSASLSGRLTARAAFLGGLYASDEAQRFTSLGVGIDGLDLLFALPPVTHSSAGHLHTFVVDLDADVTISIPPLSLAFEGRITFHPINSQFVERLRPVLKSHVVATAECDTPWTIHEWIARFVEPLRHLVGFTVGRLTPLRHLDRLDVAANSGWITDPSGNPIAGSGVEYAGEGRLRVLDLPLIRLPGDSPSADVLPRWWRVWSDERKRDAIVRMMHAQADGQTTKDRFTDIVEAAEGWHKALCLGDLPLVARLEALAAPSQSWVGHNFVPLDAPAVKDARNALAHGDILPDSSELQRHIKSLRPLVRYHILVELGLDAAVASLRVLRAEDS